MLAHGATGDFEGLPVVSVQFDPRDQPIPAAELESIVGIRPGGLLRLIEVRGAIERLFATGRYSNISADATKDGSGVVVIFRTSGTWFVSRISVDGVPEPPNAGQLVNATKLILGAELRTEDLRAASESLQKKLEANGYFESRVDPRITYDARTEQAFVDFRIDPGPRARMSVPALSGAVEEHKSRVINATRWKRFGGFLGWKPVSEARISQGLDRIRRYLARKDYLQSKITLENLQYFPTEQAVQPQISIDLGPRISVRTEGAKVSTSRLRQLVPVFQEQSADRDLVVEGMRNLTEYFRAYGYFDATVDFATEAGPGGTNAIVYTINRGDRFKLAGLSIQGNNYFNRQTIRERMLTTPATRIRYRQGRFSDSILRSDLDAIRELYVSNGFQEVRFTSGIDKNYKNKNNWLFLRIEIEEGPQTTVHKQEVSGVSIEHQEHVQALIGSTPGQPYSESGLANDRDTILDYYYNNGYLNASFDWQVTPSAQPNQVDLRILVNEGRPQFVRDFLIGGLETSDLEMVLRRIRLQPGEPLSQARIVESQRRLYDLGVFARVDVAVQNPDGLETGKYLIYQFEEARKYSLNLGFGAEIARIGSGTPNFDAPAGEPGFSPRASFGISRSNLAGTGHTLSLQSRLSNIQQRALVSYLAPQFKGRDDFTLIFSALYDSSRDVRTFQANRLEGSVQLGQRLTRAVTVQNRFAYRRNTISGLRIEDSLIPVFTRPGRVGIISTTLIQDHRDNPIDSRRGYYNTIDLGLASKAFASQTDYGRVLARNSSYHRVWRDVTFARSVAVGWLSNLRDGGPQAIPLPERFFSGGASTHRGFPDNQAGPRDLRTGFPLGGSALVTNNLELRFPLLGDSVGGVLFHDAGNVYSGLKEISVRVKQRNVADFDYMVHAVGLGIRYRTPVGPVRVDFAYGINPPRFEFERRDGFVPVVPQVLVSQRINPFQFHFSLGQTF